MHRLSTSFVLGYHGCDRALGETFHVRGVQLPENGSGPKFWMRYLDCAVIRRLHKIIKESDSPSIDTVRGIFQEGKPAYPGSAFLEKTHMQIAVTNLDCIKAVFRVTDNK